MNMQNAFFYVCLSICGGGGGGGGEVRSRIWIIVVNTRIGLFYVIRNRPQKSRNTGGKRINTEKWGRIEASIWSKQKKHRKQMTGIYGVLSMHVFALTDFEKKELVRIRRGREREKAPKISANAFGMTQTHRKKDNWTLCKRVVKRIKRNKWYTTKHPLYSWSDVIPFG